jgi:hypothetical protein
MAYIKAEKVEFLIDGIVQYRFDRGDYSIIEMDHEYQELSKQFPDVNYERRDV